MTLNPLVLVDTRDHVPRSAVDSHLDPARISPAAPGPAIVQGSSAGATHEI